MRADRTFPPGGGLARRLAIEPEPDLACAKLPCGAPSCGDLACPDLAADYFALFDLPQRFAIDSEMLAAAWRRLQTLVHPDRFAGGGAAQARLAMQWSTLVNTAYRTLRDPLERAAYLCALRGASVDAERNTAMPAAFLGEQMQWREQLEEARDGGDAGQLQALQEEVDERRAQVLARLAQLLDASTDLAQAAHQAAAEVRVLMFIDKFRRDLAAQCARTPSGAAA